jgi:phenylacetate-CoA ligase
MPILPKDTVRARPRDFLSAQATPGKWLQTSGSTGNPMRFFWGADAHREMLRGRYRFFAMWGHDIFDRMVFLWGLGHGSAPGWRGRFARCQQNVEDSLRNRLRLPAYKMGHEDLGRHLRRIAAFRPKSIYALSRAAYLLALEAEERKFRCDSLKFVTLTGEPAYPHMIQAIERAFGVPAIMEYGSTECGFVAGQWHDRTLRIREDMVLPETIPGSDGRYDIVLTVLTNPSFPLIRYAIEDNADAPLERPERGFAILGNIAGRNDDLVRTGCGGYLHPCRIDAFFEFEYFRYVRGYRVHQRADGSLTLTLELRDPSATAELPNLERRFRELVGGQPVTLEIVDSIPQTLSGKHRLVTSELGKC